MIMDGLIRIILYYFTILLCMYSYKKVLNCKSLTIAKYVFGAIFSMALAYCTFLLREFFPYLGVVIMIIAITIFAAVVTKTKVATSLTATIISMGISYGAFLFSISASVVFTHILYNEGDVLLSSAIAVILQSISIICLFKINRFSRGFPFLLNKGGGAIGCVVSGCIVTIYAVINRGVSAEIGALLLIGIALCIIGFFIWWRYGLTSYYRKRIKERDIKDHEKIIAEKDQQIKKLIEDNETMSSIIHRDNKLLPALTDAVMHYFKSKSGSVEEGEKLLVQISQLTQERNSIIKSRQYNNTSLQCTANKMLENILSYMKKRAYEESICLEIESISDLSMPIDSLIPVIKLQTIFADLIENAINATSCSEVKQIQVSSSFIENVYELIVADSGIPFEAETLLNLGKKKTTTRQREGGTGIGYMTVFKILREYNASLIIKEFKSGDSVNTKSVVVRFDNKAEYILITNRGRGIVAMCSQTHNSNSRTDNSGYSLKVLNA